MKSLKLIKILSVLVLCTCNKSYAQVSKTYDVKVNKANNVYIGKNITDAQRANVMLVTKYISKDKAVKILAGFITELTYEDIKKGKLIYYGSGSENIIKLKVVGNNLFINSRVKSVDQKIVAIIKDNKLLVNKGLLPRSSQNYIEITDDYGIPVLQVILNKDNSIEINGVFFMEETCYVLNKGSLETYIFFKPFSKMNEEEKQEALYWIRQKANLIKAIE